MKLYFKKNTAAEIGTACASMNWTGKCYAKKGPEKEYNAFWDFTNCGEFFSFFLHEGNIIEQQINSNVLLIFKLTN